MPQKFIKIYAKRFTIYIKKYNKNINESKWPSKAYDLVSILKYKLIQLTQCSNSNIALFNYKTFKIFCLIKQKNIAIICLEYVLFLLKY